VSHFSEFKASYTSQLKPMAHHPEDLLTVNSEGVMEFEFPGCVLAKNRKQVEEIVEGQVARSVAGEDFEDPVAEWIFLSFHTENHYENK